MACLHGTLLLWLPSRYGQWEDLAGDRSEREESSWVRGGREAACTSSLELIVHISCHSASR